MPHAHDEHQDKKQGSETNDTAQKQGGGPSRLVLPGHTHFPKKRHDTPARPYKLSLPDHSPKVSQKLPAYPLHLQNPQADRSSGTWPTGSQPAAQSEGAYQAKPKQSSGFLPGLPGHTQKLPDHSQNGVSQDTPSPSQKLGLPGRSQKLGLPSHSQKLPDPFLNTANQETPARPYKLSLPGHTQKLPGYSPSPPPHMEGATALPRPQAAPNGMSQDTPSRLYKLSLPGHTSDINKETPSGLYPLPLPAHPAVTGSGAGTLPPAIPAQLQEMRGPDPVRSAEGNVLSFPSPHSTSFAQPEQSSPAAQENKSAQPHAQNNTNNANSAKSSAQGKSRRRRLRLRRVPEMRQMTAVECGAACLAMVMSFYGRATSISEVQERCGVGRDGLSALAIVKAARQYGLRVRAISLKHNDFRNVSFPAIVHWEFNHFVVVERWSRKHVDLVDPALGRRRLTTEEFDEGFTGVVIMLEPGTQFERRSRSSSLTLWSYMRSLLQMRGVMAQIIGSSLLLQVLGLGAPLLTKLVVDYIAPTKASNLLLLLGVGMLFLVLTQGATKLLRASLLIYLQTHVDAQMMLNFFEHLLTLPYRFFQLRLNGDLLARVNSNTAIRDLLTSQLISTLLDGSTVIVYLGVLLSQSGLIAGTTLAIGVFQVGLLLVTAPSIRRLTLRDLAAQGKTQGYLNEVLAGIATVKAAGAEQRALNRWTNLFFEEMNISVRRNYLLSVISIILELLYVLSPLLLLWIGATQVIAGTMSIGSMIALNTLAVSFLVPLNSLASGGQMIQVARAHFERIADVVGAAPEQDPHQVQIPPPLTGRIELRNVSFQYDPNTPPILNDISVQIRPGQKVALVGRTGSGKSTLGKLLIGLITPTKGTILYDNLPLESLNFQELRKQFGVVLQETFIFSGSVRENIAFNNPEMELEQIVKAAQAAAIHEDIEAMPMGYETLVSEGGSVFSGGQRQRLSLARALANHPAILLLDEATSALDVATERVVEENVNNLSCTQVVIAHRLSTIRNADLILVLDQGRIVEQGRHDLLLRRKGFYARLIKAQVESGEIVAA